MREPQWIIHPSFEEIDTVQRYLNATRPDETQGGGTWVRYDGMERVWSGEGHGITWEVRGGLSVEPLPPQHLPARIVREAGLIAMAEEAEMSTLLVPVGGEVVIVESATTETVMDLHRNPPPAPRPPARESVARASVASGELFDLLYRARGEPNGATSEVRPDPVLIVSDGAIAIHTDWSIRGGRRTTHRLRAETEGEGRCIAPMATLVEVLVHAERDTVFEIDLPVDPYEPIILREPGAWSTHAHRPAGARRHALEVTDVLIDMLGEGFEIVEYGTFRFEIDGRVVVVRLLDAPDAIVRVGILVCDGLGGLFGVDDLVSQVNEANAGLVGARVWFDDGRVWAAIDLPVAAMGSIPWAVDKLSHQLEGFDVFLGAVGATDPTT